MDCTGRRDVECGHFHLGIFSRRLRGAPYEDALHHRLHQLPAHLSHLPHPGERGRISAAG